MAQKYYSIDTLKRISIFSSLDEEYLKKISSIAINKHYKKNEIVFHQDDIGSSLFILKSGLIKISLNDSSGREIILKMLYENDFFGEMSLLDGQYRSSTICAVKESRAMMIIREDFVSLIGHHPSIALAMVSSLSQRLRKTDDKISHLVFLDSYGKVASVLLELSAQNVIGEKNIITLDLALSRQELADMAGLSRETFTRILSEFQIRGCIKIEGKKITILNKEILKREIA